MASVTIYIQGHGAEHLVRIPDKSFFYDKYDSVSLLSFCGFIGEDGIMSFCRLENGELIPIDILAINVLHDLYFENSKKRREKRSPMEMIEHIIPTLRRVYKKCGINLMDEGFKITYPYLERSFFFKRPEHEDCKSCVKKGDPECIKRSCSICPEYGITVIDSTDEMDYYNVLASPPFTDPPLNENICEFRKRVNWSNPDTLEYWRSKAIQYASKHLDDFNFTTLKEMEDRIEYIFSTIKEDGHVFLAELIELFKMMGFEKIHFVDPTCRNCGVTVTDLERQEHTAKESKPRRRRIPKRTQPTHTLVSEPIQRSVFVEKKSNWIEECVNGVCSFFTGTKKGRGKKGKKGKQGKSKKHRLTRKR